MSHASISKKAPTSIVSSITSSLVFSAVVSWIVLAAQVTLTSTAMAAGYYAPPISEQAQMAAQKQLLKSDMRTITSDILDASKCGIDGAATLVQVQLVRSSKSVNGSKEVKSFETVKSYVVSTGYEGKVVDAETCAK